MQKKLCFILAILVLGFAACNRSDEPTIDHLQCPADESPLRGAIYFLPSGFTPNGDGLNDVLRLFTNDSASIKLMMLQIKDSTGALITTLTKPFQAWDGFNTATGTRYAAGKYGVDYHFLLKRTALQDTTIDGHTCTILFGTRSNGCNIIIGDYHTYVFEDQLDPGTLYTPYMTGENLCY